jgi:hypothetical protein
LEKDVNGELGRKAAWVINKNFMLKARWRESKGRYHKY